MKSCFEQLPNELIIDLFKYFHGEEVLRIFYNLNYRFNNLIKYINHLCLIITKENVDQIDNFHIFFPYLSTLIIDGHINLNLCLFNQIRALILTNPTDELLIQIDTCMLDNLEHLSVKFIRPIYRIKKVFSNGFPNLRSYYNLGYDTIRTIEGCTQTPNLRRLKLGYMELSIFKTILSSCPNLDYLDFGIITSYKSSSKIQSHLNLKQLILRTAYKTWPSNENLSIFENIFICLPNLEKLSIHRRDNISIIRQSLIKYNWLSPILYRYFPKLTKFNFYFHIFQLRNAKIQIGPNLKNTLDQIIENFQNITIDPARLEILPNELLIQICKHLDAGDIYRAFYNTNIRFNTLIQSVDELRLTVSLSDNYEDVCSAVSFDNIYTLIVNKNVNVTIGHFSNLRCLILHWLSTNVLDKIEYDLLPYLEYLYIDSHRLFDDDPNSGISYKIFTNGFPQLKYCSLSKIDIQPSTSIWCEMPSINILKVGFIDLSVYEKILSSCPNLSLFEFGIVRWGILSYCTKNHVNIKTSVIKMENPLARWTIDIKQMYLSRLPNLERLNIRIEKLYIPDAIDLFKSEWLSQIVDSNLSKLRRVDVYIPIVSNIDNPAFIDEKNLDELKQSREQTYKDCSYQVKVTIF